MSTALPNFFMTGNAGSMLQPAQLCTLAPQIIPFIHSQNTTGLKQLLASEGIAPHNYADAAYHLTVGYSLSNPGHALFQDIEKLKSYFRTLRNVFQEEVSGIYASIAPVKDESSSLPQKTVQGPIEVNFLNGEIPSVIDLNRPLDAQITFSFQNRYRGYEQQSMETAFAVATGDFFRQHVKWKVGFSLYKQNGEYFLYVSNWQDPEKRSAHDIIIQARNQLIEASGGEVNRSDYFEKGYIKAESDGSFTIFELSMCPYERNSSSMAGFRSVSNRLTPKAQALLRFFRSMGLRVEIEGSGHSVAPRTMPMYGPR